MTRDIRQGQQGNEGQGQLLSEKITSFSVIMPVCFAGLFSRFANMTVYTYNIRMLLTA